MILFCHEYTNNNYSHYINKLKVMHELIRALVAILFSVFIEVFH